MRIFCLLLTLICANYTYAKAQITVTDITFPKAGDTLRTSTATNLKGYSIEKSGIGKTWDFVSLKVNAINETIIAAAKDGSAATDFPKANLVEKRIGSETYIISNAKSYETIGIGGVNATGIGTIGSTKLSPTAVNRRAPMNFLDLNNTNFALAASIPLSALPDSILGQIGQLTALIDSIRIKQTSSRTDLVDGHGTIKIPMGTYEVLREKRLQYTNRKLEVRTKIFGSWTDITALLPANQLPPQVKNLIKTDTSFTYNFFSKTQKEVIAVATMDNIDNTKVNTVTYKNIKKTTPIIDFFGENRPDVRAFPNPATDEVNLEMTSLNPGTYTLKIYNLLGAVVWQETHTVVGGIKTVKVNLTNFRKGSYLYSVSNSGGKILATKRLLIMKA